MESPPPSALHPGQRQPLSPRRAGVSELCLGCRVGIRAGRRERGQERSPAPSPGQTRGGRGQFPLGAGEARGGRGGRGRRPAPRPFLGRAKRIRPGLSRRLGPTRSGSSGPETRGMDPTGQGSARGRPHRVSALGEGAVRRAFRSLRDAAESGTRGPRATGIPSPGTGPADEFPVAGAEAAQSAGRGAPFARQRGVDPQDCQELLELSGSSGFAGGASQSVRARVLRGQVRKGVTLPFPVPDPIVSVAGGPGRLRNTCWLHRYECLEVFSYFLFAESELTPTPAHRSSA